MKHTDDSIQKAVPPEEFTEGKFEKPSNVAAGLKGITVAMQHLKDEVGVDAVATLMPKMNQFKGFDCPGCAWPDPDEKRSFLGEYCENGAKAVAEEATRKKADPAFWQKHSVFELSNLSDYELGKSGRITQPMYLPEGATHYEPIEWEQAFDMVVDELKKLNDPNEAIFYTSGRTSNEAAFLYQLFVRCFGTNNLPDCSNMCHESSGTALTKTIGIGKGTVKLEDFHKAEVIMIFGQNPGTNHPRMLSALEEAKKKGAHVIAVNPLKEPGLIKFKNPQGLSMLKATAISDQYVQVPINGDLALVKALMYLLNEAEKKKPGTVFDASFIKDQTTGYKELIAHIEEQDFPTLVQECGISEKQLRQVADQLIKRNKIIICWAMGLTQHKNAVPTIQEIVNLLLLKGSIGKPGAGACPVRGHSNVQGDRTMGIFEKPAKSLLDNLEATFDRKMPRENGWDVVDAIKAMHEGQGKVFFAMGGNFLSATPDTLYTAKALQNCSFTVHVSTKPNRSHLIHGKKALILPCLGRSEEDLQAGGNQFVSVENSMGVVHQSQGDRKPASDHLKSEVDIVAQLGQRLFGDMTTIQWSTVAHNYDTVRDLIEKVIPGFEDYNQRVRQKGGFYLPNGPRYNKFTTPDKKAHFTVNSLEAAKAGEGQYILMTIRSHDQFNTTIYGLDDRYRGVSNERRVVFMNPKDMAAQGLQTRDVVNLTSHFKGEKRVAYRFLAIPYDIPRGNTAAYFPETNVLVPIDSTADESNTPVSKAVVISVEKA